MAGSTSLIARRSIRSRLGRTISIASAILMGVAFVVGTFVLADSLKATFEGLFSDINENIDLEVRQELAFGDEADGVQRDPIPLEIAEQMGAIDGVREAVPTIGRYAQVIDGDGDAVTLGGGPTLGVTDTEDEELSTVTVFDGRRPTADGEVALDGATAEKAELGVGDPVQITTDAGTFDFEIVGLVGLGDTEAFGGASISVFPLETALEVLGTDGKIDAVDISLENGADPAAVRADIEEAIPDGTEVITGEELSDEQADAVNQFVDIFATGLLIFAFITAFVSAFIINNVFAITIGQRLRELALLRAIGAAGGQVRRMIYVEALVMSLVATVLGIGAGVLIAKGLTAVFNAAGAGFPTSGTVISLRTIAMAFLVGVGITMLSVVVPARRAAKIPPVAAMRPELGFDTINARRLVGGTITLVLGALMFVAGLFLRPGGTIGLIALAGGGGLLIFIGVASVSSTIARPVVRCTRLADPQGLRHRWTSRSRQRRTFATPDVGECGGADDRCRPRERRFCVRDLAAGLRRERARRRSTPTTSSRAIRSRVAALGRGRAARRARDRRRDADPGQCRRDRRRTEGHRRRRSRGARPAHRPRGARRRIAGRSRRGRHLRPRGRGVRLRARRRRSGRCPLPERRRTHADDDGRLRRRDVRRQLPRVARHARRSHPTRREPAFFVVAKLQPGTDPAQARTAINEALDDLPQAKAQTVEEFVGAQEDQINQILVVISSLLVFAIAIAVLGISITLALAVFERTRDRPAARRRHEQAPDATRRAVGGGDRLAVRGDRWRRRRLAHRRGAHTGRAGQRHRGPQLLVADRCVHPDRRRDRRPRRLPLPLLQGLPNGRPRRHRHRMTQGR
ncbi:MAG: ABC transporter permease [Ilumatobacteraceae bacterium]